MPSLLTCSAADTTSVRNAVSSFERALGDGSELMEHTLQWLHTSVKHKGSYCNKPKMKQKFLRSRLQRDLVRGKARFRKPSQSGQPGSCEEALSFFCVTNRPLS